MIKASYHVQNILKQMYHYKIMTEIKKADIKVIKWLKSIGLWWDNLILKYVWHSLISNSLATSFGHRGYITK